MFIFHNISFFYYNSVTVFLICGPRSVSRWAIAGFKYMDGFETGKGTWLGIVAAKLAIMSKYIIYSHGPFADFKYWTDLTLAKGKS